MGIMKKPLILAAVMALAPAVMLLGQGQAQTDLTPQQMLGEFLYFDENLSTPTGQSCASCHDPGFGFVDPDSDLPVSQGVLPKNRFGNRNSPSSAYAMYAPIRYFDEDEGLWIGGQFWDSRATGEVLGDPLADQALGPFLNVLEMNNPSKLIVIEKVLRSEYADLFEQVCGPVAPNEASVNAAYDCVALSIGVFERTELFAQFSSKYDAYLKACLDLGGDMNECATGVGDAAVDAGAEILAANEWNGLQLFMDENSAKCVLCHVADWTAEEDYALPVVVPSWAPEGDVPPVFTDFTYDNLGAPKNPDNPFYDLPKKFNPDGQDFVDIGLGGVVGEEELGKSKVMSLRNIGVTAPYLHNGVFDTLEEVVHFYNTRDVDPSWPPPEVSANVNTEELGDLGLTTAEEEDVAAFMRTLTDGTWPSP
jgi:cytochrome c peroxidase